VRLDCSTIVCALLSCFFLLFFLVRLLIFGVFDLFVFAVLFVVGCLVWCFAFVGLGAPDRGVKLYVWLCSLVLCVWLWFLLSCLLVFMLWVCVCVVFFFSLFVVVLVE